MFTFTNQTVIVTGATRGIGRAISEAFLAAGARVVGLYAGNTAAAESFAAANAAAKDRLRLQRCNVASEKEVQKFYQQLEQKGEGVQVLINCAGIRRDAALAMMKHNDWQSVIDINLSGSFLMSRGAVPLMMQGKYGRIINITSPIARLGFAGQGNYAASKAGQVAMARSLAKEVARKNITVNCISPGFIATDFIADLPEKQVKAYKQMVPMRRFGTVEEVADAALFLASAKAGYISGTVLEVAGGL
ncbi:MAG: beta-ketoacyl-ACP reductase [Desulfobacterales bacterium]|nr:MAG: beta-ketoacyl-ACP reductase [Desulfobacterales bacterium]